MEESKSDARILFEAEIIYDYPKLYLPVSIHATHFEDSPVALDKYVKYYMIWFGIDNVRGGSYSNPDLPDYQHRTLLEEMNTASNTENLSELVEYANQPHTKEELVERLQTLRFNYAKYEKESQKKINIDLCYIRKELFWLDRELPILKRVANTYLCKIERMAAIKRYRDLLQLLHKVRTIAVDVLEMDIDDPLVKNPEFIFDDFIYHHHRIHLEISMTHMKETIKQYNHMLNIIENRKTERDFDIASWGPHPGRDMPREIYLLEKMIKK